MSLLSGAPGTWEPLSAELRRQGAQGDIHDLNVTALDKLRRGELPFVEYEAQGLLHEALKADRLVCSSKPEDISRETPVIITIGTPVDEFLNPVNRVVKDCVDELLPYLADGQLIILRSTVYPGTTDWLAGYLARPRSQAQGRVLSRARRARLRRSRAAKHAAARKRRDAGGRRGSSGIVRIDRARACAREAHGGGVRQAVRQRISLHRVGPPIPSTC